MEVYDTAIIRDITYTLKSLKDIWQIDLSIYLECGVGPQTTRVFEGYLFVSLTDVPEIAAIEKHIIISKSKIDSFKETITIDVPKYLVELWWPNGFGNQKLYCLNVTWLGGNRDILTNEIKQIPIEYLRFEKVIHVGFRTAELHEDQATDGTLFYFKINDIPIFMKGTNLIPIDILPEKMFDKVKIEYLMLSTKEAHMNLIRVWGGGVYESDHFYDLADKHGILIWQDMMFACAMYPVNPSFLASVEVEITQNVRRLQRHPSILVWAGNNENEVALIQNWYGTQKEQPRFILEYIQLYRDVIERAVRENDEWHIWLYSSPSNGNETNKVINENPQDNNRGDGKKSKKTPTKITNLKKKNDNDKNFAQLQFIITTTHQMPGTQIYSRKHDLYPNMVFKVFHRCTASRKQCTHPTKLVTYLNIDNIFHLAICQLLLQSIKISYCQVKRIANTGMHLYILAKSFKQCQRKLKPKHIGEHLMIDR